MVQKEWFTLLERSRSRHWLACLHLGVMQYHAGDKERAQRFWEDSLGQRTTPWALRNLARLSHDAKRPAEAAGLYLQAYRMCPALTPLAIECGRALIEAGRSTDFLGLLDGMPPSVRRYGRIRLLEARADLEVGDLDRAEGILTEDHLSVPDLYEGELLLSETWYRLKEQRLARAAGAPVDEALQARVRRDFPPPANLDFRMAAVVK
jgi:tetratricopeptide (TPR) repeat protein